jgi:hypothetical protein
MKWLAWIVWGLALWTALMVVNPDDIPQIVNALARLVETLMRGTGR